MYNYCSSIKLALFILQQRVYEIRNDMHCTFSCLVGDLDLPLDVLLICSIKENLVVLSRGDYFVLYVYVFLNGNAIYLW